MASLQKFQQIVMDEHTHKRPNGIPVTHFSLQSISAQSDHEKLEFEYESGNTKFLANDYSPQPKISRQGWSFENGRVDASLKDGLFSIPETVPESSICSNSYSGRYELTDTDASHTGIFTTPRKLIRSCLDLEDVNSDFFGKQTRRLKSPPSIESKMRPTERRINGFSGKVSNDVKGTVSICNGAELIFGIFVILVVIGWICKG